MNPEHELKFATVSQPSAIDENGVRVLSTQLLYREATRNYPGSHQRLCIQQITSQNGAPDIPSGDWWVQAEDNRELSPEETQSLRAQGVTHFDSAGRPIHPWVSALSQYPDFGFACGRGAYRQWGPNYTADPIVVRHDLAEPHLLLIERSDTGEWALPGGFIDPGEDGLAAAVREAQEETGIVIPDNATCALTYQGVVADPRTTLHAWPETTAVRFDLPDEYAATLAAGSWEGSDDAKLATWVPLSTLPERLFGSHLALVRQAVESPPWKS